MTAHCTSDTCKELKTQTTEEAMKCTKSQVVKDDIDGCKLHFLTVLGSPYELNMTDYFIGLTTLPGNALEL
jgi:radical SAM superfamily enzyme